MNTELLGIILSGQFILVVWEIYKGIMDRRDKKKAEAKADSDDSAAIKSMVFKLYRDSMEQKILNLYPKVDNKDEDLKEALLMLQDDMEFYVKQGGNGLIKELYVRLARHVRETVGERHYLLMVVDGIPEFEHNQH